VSADAEVPRQRAVRAEGPRERALAADAGAPRERVPAPEDVSAQECEPAAEQLARAFRFLGKRWTAMILGHLSHGATGFRDLSRGIGGISDSVLSERLADLAAGGLITRTVCAGPPVTVTYQLTERGRALMPALGQIAQWALDNLPPDA
jgi:DNA-binding HxlR family transcriptional regulator